MSAFLSRTGGQTESSTWSLFYSPWDPLVPDIEMRTGPVSLWERWVKVTWAMESMGIRMVEVAAPAAVRSLHCFWGAMGTLGSRL